LNPLRKKYMSFGSVKDMPGDRPDGPADAGLFIETGQDRIVF
jgi:hypothetical protein